MARLVASAVGGDADAMRKLAARLLPIIRSRVRRRLGRAQCIGSMQARDLVQEVCVVLCKNDFAQIRRWDAARGASFEGYLSMIVDREVSNHRRQVSAKRRGGSFKDAACVDELLDTTPTPECLALERSGAEELWLHLSDSLSPRGKQVLTELCLDHGTPEQIALSLGVDRQIIYNWRHEIRKRARHFLLNRERAYSQQRKRGQPQ